MAECISEPNFLWKIENFASINMKVSPAIFIGDSNWVLKFHRFWDNNEDKIFLILESVNSPTTLSTWQFKTNVSFIYPCDAVRYRTQTGTYSFKKREDCCIWSGTVSLIYSTLGQVKDVFFSILITLNGDVRSLFKNQQSVEENSHESLCVKSLIEDFGRLFNNEENNDFVLQCGEESFYVHKAVLSARSDFFAGMFRSDMKETNEGAGKIENIEPNILELVLRYMYTGDIPELSMTSLQKIYTAADRFGVESLKIKCYSLFIHQLIRPANCSGEDTLNLNEPSETVQKETIKIVEKKFLKDLFMSNEWNSFSQKFPVKAQEMCRPYLLQM